MKYIMMPMVKWKRNMPSSNETLKDRLARYRQIKISVTVRKSGADNLDTGLVRIRRRQAATFCPCMERIEERFRKVFKREMTREERYAFFLPEDDWTKSQG
jgi:hypothetical protein